MNSPTPSSDGGYGEPTPSKQKKKRNPPSEPRKLVRWNADIDQLLLLGVDAVCARMGVALPWDEIGKEVADFVTGEGVKQHIGKVRLARAKAGRKVPDKPEKMRRKSRVKEPKAEEDDEVEQGSTAKLMSLLYHGKETQPKAKTTTPKKPKATAATTPGGSSNPTKGRKRVKSLLDREAVLGSSNTASPTKKKSTGKRGRKTKTEQLREEEEEFEDATPTKRQRTYELRAIASEPVYKDQLDDDDDDDDYYFDMLAPKEQGDEEEYRDDDDDEDGEAEDDKMEGVKGDDEPSPQKSVTKFDMPPPSFNYSQAATGMGDVNPSQYQSRMQLQHHSNSTSSIQPNPLHISNYTVPMLSYEGYDNAAQVPLSQDPFSMNMMTHGNPGFAWPQSSMMPMPRPEESAMRSSLNTTPRLSQNGAEAGKATKTEGGPKKVRNDSKQQEFKTPEKKKSGAKASQATTPANQAKTPLQAAAGSPFDSVREVEKTIDTSNAILDATGMTNYSYTMGAPNMDYYAGHYTPGTGVSNYGINYGNGMNNTDMRVQTDYKSDFGSNNVVISPDTYSPTTFNGFPAAPANSPVNANFAVNMSGLPVFDNAAISNPLFFANSSASMTPAHSGSFDSMITSVQGSQTDERNEMFNFDVGNEDQTQQDEVDFNYPITFDHAFNSMPDSQHDDLFGGAGC